MKARNIILSIFSATVLTFVPLTMMLWLSSTGSRWKVVTENFVWETSQPFWPLLYYNVHNNLYGIILWLIGIFTVSLLLFMVLDTKSKDRNLSMEDVKKETASLPKITTAFRSTKDPVKLYEVNKVPVLRAEEIVEALWVRRHGLNDGQNNLPPTKATELSKTEAHILSYHQKFMGRAKNYINKSLGDIQREMYRLKSTFTSFNQLKNKPKNDFKKYMIEKEQELVESRTTERKALRDLKRFRVDNNLQREAVYPKSRILYIAFLAVLVVGEAVANAYFFATGNEFGLLGGWLQASLFSGINVLLSFIAGFFILRMFNHISIMYKSAATVLVVLSFVALTAFHFLVAHYRDALRVDPDNAMLLAVSNWFNLKHLETIDAYGLLLFGFVITVFAIIDGFHLDDRYPGYGKVDRRHKEAEKHYLSKDKETRAKRVEIQNTIENEIRKYTTKAENDVEKIRGLINNAHGVFAQIDHINHQAAGATLQAINVYREANKSVRTDAEPAYFVQEAEIQSPLTQDDFEATLQFMERFLGTSTENLSKMYEDAETILTGMAEESSKLDTEIEEITDKTEQLAESRMN